MEELNASLRLYTEQLAMINEALGSTQNDGERESLRALQSEMQVLVQLTQESLTAVSAKEAPGQSEAQKDDKNELDEEYALFMQEMAETGAYEAVNCDEAAECSNRNQQENENNSDLEEDLSTLLGMKCAVFHTHKWGGQPSLHNAMVSAVIPRQDDDQFKDLQVQVLYTHPTHAEMLPCPFYLDGECRFDDEQCRYSHGAVTLLSDLKDAIEPNFSTLRIGSRILLKLKPPEDEDISLTKKSTEKYHLWHRAIVRSIDLEKKVCFAKLEHGVQTGDKRKSDELQVSFEEIFPLNCENDADSESDDSLSDTEYLESKSELPQNDESRSLLIEKSLQSAGPAIGEWERHTRGIGSKLMLAMGYVPGTGLGAEGDGRVQPVEARVLPVGKSLDHCMAISESAAQDPLKVEQKLRKLQRKEEERNKRAYEREKEKEKRNVFNFLNKTLGNEQSNKEPSPGAPSVDVKQSTSKDLNIEKFKINEDMRKIEREIMKLSSSLTRHPAESALHRSFSVQLLDKNKQLSVLRNKEQQIAREQNLRKNKHNMTSF